MYMIATRPMVKTLDAAADIGLKLVIIRTINHSFRPFL